MPFRLLKKKQLSSMAIDFDAIARHYDRTATTIEDSAKAMGWKSRFRQEIRYDAMHAMVDFEGSSVLDCGCGDGGLFRYFKSQQVAIDYRGIDISSEMVKRAKRVSPDIVVERGQFLDHHETADIVVCSGSLTFQPEENPYKFLKKALRHLVSISNEHVIFNLLNPTGNFARPHQMYDPVTVLGICLDISPYVSFNQTYLPDDFTILISIQK